MVLDLHRRTVTRDGTDLAVFEAGNSDAATIVFVHGWPDTHQMWAGVMELLAGRFRVVAYDLRGMGESSDPGEVEHFSLEEQARDLFAVIDAVSPDAPVHVVAHDWGSVFAWEAVCEEYAEERIASFTSISGPNIDHLAHWVRGTLRRPTPGDVAGVLAQLTSSSYIGVFVTPVGRWFFGNVASERRWERFLSRVEGFRPEAWHHAPTLTRDMVSGLRIYQANVARRLGSPPRERRTSVPVLQVAPTRDIAIRGSALGASEGWATQLERHEVPYGHWVALGHPDVVAEEVERFVRRVGSPHAV